MLKVKQQKTFKKIQTLGTNDLVHNILSLIGIKEQTLMSAASPRPLDQKYSTLHPQMGAVITIITQKQQTVPIKMQIYFTIQLASKHKITINTFMPIKI